MEQLYQILDDDGAMVAWVRAAGVTKIAKASGVSRTALYRFMRRGREGVHSSTLHLIRSTLESRTIPVEAHMALRQKGGGNGAHQDN